MIEVQKKFRLLWLIVPLLFSGCEISIIETPSNSFGTTSKQPTTSQVENSSTLTTSITPSTSTILSTSTITPSTSIISSSTSSSKVENWKDTYYYDNSYTSIYDIVQSWRQNHLLEENIKTWGIVSRVFKNLEGNQCFYLQSETNNHEHSAILVNNYSGSVNIQKGNVITLEGIMKFEDNTLSLTEHQNLHVDYEVALDSLDPYEITKDYLSSSELDEVKKQGHRYVSLSHVSIEYQTQNSIYANMDTESIEIVIENSSSASKVHSALSQISNNDFINLWGVLKYGSEENSSLQFAIASTEDIENPYQNASQIVLDSNVSSATSNRYSTGNYGYFTYQNYTFDYYRTAYSNYESYFLKMLSLSYRNALGGMLSNYDAIPDILSIEVSYYVENIGSKNPRLYYGSYNQLHDYKEMNQSLKTIQFVADFKANDNIQYFRFETGDATLYLNSMTIRYLNQSEANERTYASSGEGLYRINPSYYTGNLKEGASFTLPVETEKVGNSYQVISEKTYYYYSYSYLESHPELVDLGTYTDPSDVANYFNAFHTYPANYVSKSEYSSAKSIFGTDTRIWSYYERTDGYATVVPYRNGEEGVPRYYELDIDLDGSYSNTSRGVGRLVVWLDGWDVDNYDNNPVTVYTDDHYATFQEYYNNGNFSYRFNAITSSRRSNFTNYTWGAPITL